MGRDNTGKQQEQQQLAQNQAQKQTDIASRDKQLSTYDTSVQNLSDNPGYSPEDLSAMEAESGAGTSSLYGSAMDNLERADAQQGWSNDAGLGPQVEEMTAQRGRDIALGKNNIAANNAAEKLATRRALPGLNYQPVNAYQGDATALGGQNTSLTTSRMEQDSKPTFLQSLALSGVQAAGQAATGSIAGCWIAEAVYGTDDSRTHIVRAYLNGRFREGLFGKFVMAVYYRLGRRVARLVRESERLQRAFRPVFDLALSKALSDL